MSLLTEHFDRNGSSFSYLPTTSAMTEVVLVATRLDSLKHLSSEESIVQWSKLQKIVGKTDWPESFFSRFQIEDLCMKRKPPAEAMVRYKFTQG